MMREYQLEGGEYTTIIDALRYAEEHAVHSQGKARFHKVRQQLMRQWEEHEE